MDSIRAIGLSQFSKQYFWPISDEEFVSFVDSVMIEFDQTLLVSDDDIFDLVISDYRFLVFLIQHIHYLGALSRLDSKHTHNTDWSPTLKELLYPDWQKHMSYFSLENLESGHFGNYRNTLRSQIGGRARHFLHTLQTNKNNPLLNNITRTYYSPEHISIGPFTQFKRAFLNSSVDYSRVAE